MFSKSLALIALSVVAFGQKPDTKLEAFQARTGIVFIQGYSTVGEIGGSLGTISVKARELRDGSNPGSPVATGISISITAKESGRQDRDSTSYVDSDEINSLVKGIEYISKVTKDATKLDRFEAVYQTRGDLRITVFNASALATERSVYTNAGEISAAVSSGTTGQVRLFISLEKLDKLRELILLAKSKL